MRNGKTFGSLTTFFGGRNREKDPNALDREEAFTDRQTRQAEHSEQPGVSGDVIALTAVDVERAHGIALITLQTRDGSPIPGYEPGCHADFLLRSPEGEELVRQFSLFPMHQLGAEDAGERAVYGIEVKLETDSRGGSIAAHNIEPGDTVRILPPRNNFALAPGAKRSILVLSLIHI